MPAPPDVRRGRVLHPESTMNGLYWIGGTIAIGLLLYLVVALLKPEKFS